MSIHRDNGTFDWDGIPVLAYKEEGSHFRSITRRTLFEGDDSLPGELRYFEIAPGGHSTLERHEHLHVVMILRGKGRALVGDAIHGLGAHDLVEIEPHTWHQFHASGTEPFGFLCLVSRERDRPHRPDEKELAELRRSKVVTDFVKV